jgi:hypothetical protein
MQREAAHVLGGKDEVVAERYRLVGDDDFAPQRVPCGDLAALIKLPVCWQIGFRNDAQETTAMEDERRVV